MELNRIELFFSFNPQSYILLLLLLFAVWCSMHTCMSRFISRFKKFIFLYLIFINRINY